MLEDNLKMAFTIIHGHCTESILTKLGGIANMKTPSMIET